MDKKYKDFDPGIAQAGDIYLLANPVTSVLKKVVVSSSLLIKRYSALLTQSGSGDPTANEFENDIGSITWSRVSAGLFTATCADAFHSGKTFINPNNSTVRAGASESGILIERIDDNTLQIITDDDALLDFPILIITKS